MNIPNVRLLLAVYAVFTLDFRGARQPQSIPLKPILMQKCTNGATKESERTTQVATEKEQLFDHSRTHISPYSSA